MVQAIQVRPVEKVALFTRHTLAAYLDVHVNTIDRLVKRGEIVAYGSLGVAGTTPRTSSVTSGVAREVA